MVDVVRTHMTSPSCVLVENIKIEDIHNPNLLSYASVCGKAKAVWNTFAQSDDEVRLKIKRINAKNMHQSKDSEKPEKRTPTNFGK